ncbi:MAG: hypothetical protein NXI21_00940 [Alphaproteobacteria bacterium]|nr:hypothetical protein [Alphaproteobacteria bacterium]
MGLVLAVGLLAPPLAASAGVGTEDRRAVLLFAPSASSGSAWRAVLTAGGRPVAERFGGLLVLAAFDGPPPLAALSDRGMVMALDAALLERCGAF